MSHRDDNEKGSKGRGPRDENAVLTTNPLAEPGQKAWKAKWRTIALRTVKETWFLIALAILIDIASQVQVPESQQHTKTTIINYLCVTIIFLITGCTLDTQTLLRNYSRWKIHIFLQTSCFLLTSAIMFGLVTAVATDQHFMDPGLLVGLIFFSCVPMTISSNVVMTRQAHGNAALAVVQTTVSNFIGVFITPALVTMYTSVDTWYNAALPPNQGRFQDIYARVLKQLGLSLYLPLFIGQVLRCFFPTACQRVFTTWKLGKIGSLALLIIIWQSYDAAFASGAFDTVPASNKIFIVFICVAMWLLLFLISFGSSILWLPKKDVVAVCYCVPAKGPAMGVPLATTIFAGLDRVLESKILIPIIIYQGLQVAAGSICVILFRRWIDKDEAKKRTVAGPSSEEAGVGQEQIIDESKT